MSPSTGLEIQVWIFLNLVLGVDLAHELVLSGHESHFRAAVGGGRGCGVVGRRGSQEALRSHPDLHRALLDVLRIRHVGHRQAGGRTTGPAYDPRGVSGHVLVGPGFARRESKAAGIDGLSAGHLHALGGRDVVDGRRVAAHVEFRWRQRRTCLLPDLVPLTNPVVLDGGDAIGRERRHGRVQCA